jgi:hypothetical protein
MEKMSKNTKCDIYEFEIYYFFNRDLEYLYFV